MLGVPVGDVWSRPGATDDEHRVTQAVRGEPVEVVVRGDQAAVGWVRVVLPWQPSSLDPRGYPGWMVAEALASSDALPPCPSSSVAGRGEELLDEVRRHLGTPYVWGGTVPGALDCSGLVHLAARTLGAVVPRDAHDQQDSCAPVPLGEERAGDLYFFARPGAPAHHVGVVVRPGVMVHAPQTGAHVVEEPLDEARRATLVAAGRLTDPATPVARPERVTDRSGTPGRAGSGRP